MATHAAGSEGVVKITTNTIAEVTEWSYDETCDTIDDSQLSDTAKSYLAGQKDSSGTVDCHWDETDTNGQEAMLVGASVTLNLYPEGATAGDKYYSGSVIITGISVSGRMNDTVRRRFTFKPVAGVLTYGTAV